MTVIEAGLPQRFPATIDFSHRFSCMLTPRLPATTSAQQWRDSKSNGGRGGMFHLNDAQILSVGGSPNRHKILEHRETLWSSTPMMSLAAPIDWRAIRL